MKLRTCKRRARQRTRKAVVEQAVIRMLEYQAAESPAVITPAMFAIQHRALSHGEALRLFGKQIAHVRYYRYALAEVWPQSEGWEEWVREHGRIGLTDAAVKVMDAERAKK